MTVFILAPLVGAAAAALLAPLLTTNPMPGADQNIETDRDPTGADVPSGRRNKGSARPTQRPAQRTTKRTR